MPYTFVLVHGSWHDNRARIDEAVAARLQEAAIAESLPTDRDRLYRGYLAHRTHRRP